MTEHVHGCLTCKPDMVPDFDRADPRYHDRDTCGVGIIVTVDGAPVTYTRGVYEGSDGWALFAGASVEDVHDCPTCTVRDAEGFIVTQSVCLVPLFGRTEVVHACPPRLKRIEAMN